MRSSETLTEIAAALSKAQSEMGGAAKSADNPFFKKSYADLASVIAAITGPFSSNGLSFVQSPGFSESRIVVTTRILHSSGEWLEGDTVLPPTKNDAQGYGSAITYAKRYGLQAMAGVPSVDDDGNGAVEHRADGSRTGAFDGAVVGSYVRLISEALINGEHSEVADYFRELTGKPERVPVWESLTAAQRNEIKKHSEETK